MDKNLLRGSLLAIGLVLVLNTAIFYVAKAITPESRFFDSLLDLQLTNALLYSVVAVVVAAVVLWLLARFSESPSNLFLWLLLIIFLLSLILPYTRALNTWTFAAWGLMHVVVAWSIGYGLILFERPLDQ